MENNEYLDFDQAVSFLKTTPSTLYKWLQSGKVPGHKLGRQWRFLRDELEFHVSGKAPKVQHQKELLKFADFLNQRTKQKSKEGFMENLGEKLIWDAYDRGVKEIHLSPKGGRYEVTYRKSPSNVESQVGIEESLLKVIDESWVLQSSPIKTDNRRRFVLHRDEDQSLQVQYRKVDTITGPHITLYMMEAKQDILDLERLMEKNLAEKVRAWMAQKRGLIIISGSAGSGKTTTVYSMMEATKNTGKVVFTLESPATLIFDGVSQVEYVTRDADDFEANLLAISAAGADVIVLGLGETGSLKRAILKAAINKAKDGVLVLLQLPADSIEEAVEKYEDAMSESMKSVPVSILWQELKTDGGRLKAHYKIRENLFLQKA